jgi:hypothetical protein
MACITRLEQESKTGTWNGIALKQGEVRKFNTLEDYKQYVKSLENQGTYCPDVEPQFAQKYQPGRNETRPPFMQFQVRDPEKQAKYSAMSPTWEGIESSEAAVARGDYSLDSAEATRRELREKVNVPVTQVPTTVWQNCVIQ